MTLFDRFDQWSDKHHSGWIDGLRIVLGLALLAKGFVFAANSAKLQAVLLTYFGTDSVVFSQIISGVHLLAGFLLIIGLATRIACLIQIPFVLGAIIFVNSHLGSTEIGELFFSIIVLFLLVFFFFEGSGRISVYYYMKNSIRSRIPATTQDLAKDPSNVSLVDDDQAR